MDEKFKLTTQQQNFIKEKMGVSDVNSIKLIFEVQSMDTKSISDFSTNKSTKLSFMMCPCGDGSWSWLCC